ncbi:class F sortase [Falsibacillus albus]|uniref:Class F sortase n=1 Tax=Falsibacillus albus TaxID=2478915 RepID=A0A3L7JRJ9_9BACI|nr:class F sortase [Falsibacillus albus]RLQ93110.1 class F sortase [Falsibacillus albus]
MKRLPLLFFAIAISLVVAGFVTSANSSSKQEASHRKDVPPVKIAHPKGDHTISTTTTPSKFADKIVKDERTGIVPVRIQIPAIDVDAKVEKVGRLANGKMGVPGGFESTGWYEGGYKPGEPGNAVIDGHVDSKKGPAVFYYLKDLKKGDEIIITGENNKKRVFAVTSVETYIRDDSPVKDIFNFSYGSHLNLITCAGVYDPKTTENSKRLVVYSQLKEAN